MIIEDQHNNIISMREQKKAIRPRVKTKGPGKGQKKILLLRKKRGKMGAGRRERDRPSQDMRTHNGV